MLKLAMLKGIVRDKDYLEEYEPIWVDPVEKIGDLVGDINEGAA